MLIRKVNRKYLFSPPQQIWIFVTWEIKFSKHDRRLNWILVFFLFVFFLFVFFFFFRMLFFVKRFFFFFVWKAVGNVKKFTQGVITLLNRFTDKIFLSSAPKKQKHCKILSFSKNSVQNFRWYNPQTSNSKLRESYYSYFFCKVTYIRQRITELMHRKHRI